MSVSIDEFADEVRRDIEAFVADYKKEHAKNPEQYPLAIENDNAGLWCEFFVDFMMRDHPQAE